MVASFTLERKICWVFLCGDVNAAYKEPRCFGVRQTTPRPDSEKRTPPAVHTAQLDLHKAFDTVSRLLQGDAFLFFSGTAIILSRGPGSNNVL